MCVHLSVFHVLLLKLLQFILWGYVEENIHATEVPDCDNLIRSIFLSVTDIKDQLDNWFMSGNPFVITVSKHLNWRRYL
jgi:hypothetical protein